MTHLGKLLLEGPGALEALDVALTADVGALEPSRASYALVLTEGGGCIDDVFVYRLDRERWLVVPNAANVEAVAAAIRESGGEPVDAWDRWAILALQGPRSFDVFTSVWPDHPALELKLHTFTTLDDGGLVARTGYTGERGFELYVTWDQAASAFERLVDAGAAPVGLGARDTLRLEMGYALYGHELSLDINPLEAGLGWTLAWDTPFRGREALAKVRAEGAARKLFGIRCIDRGVPRQDYEVIVGEESVGRVTSGNFSPTLGTGIALALAPTERVPADGESAAIVSRGRRIAGDIVKPPFIAKSK